MCPLQVLNHTTDGCHGHNSVKILRIWTNVSSGEPRLGTLQVHPRWTVGDKLKCAQARSVPSGTRLGTLPFLQAGRQNLTPQQTETEHTKLMRRQNKQGRQMGHTNVASNCFPVIMPGGGRDKPGAQARQGRRTHQDNSQISSAAATIANITKLMKLKAHSHKYTHLQKVRPTTLLTRHHISSCFGVSPSEFGSETNLAWAHFNRPPLGTLQP